MQWVREYSKPYKLELKYSPSNDRWYEVQNTLTESKKWCKNNNMMIWDDGLFYIRFTNERDLSWFLLRWA
jgi:hypothetical protein